MVASLLPSLPSRFAAAGLELVLERGPIDAGRGRLPVEIVQMDIARRRRREWFRIFPGATDNRLEVTTVDPTERQLVLFVQEAGRPFEATWPRNHPVPAGTRVLFEDATKRIVILHTAGRKRHFLCGMDESHLFIAQLPRAAPTVSMAHRALAPTVPDDYREQTMTRQGEWFFLPALREDADELDRIAVLGYRIRRNVGIAEGAKLRRAGREHLVSELCVLHPGQRIFVRGAVRHPDHKTVELHGWHRVLPNREVNDMVGLRWVD